MTDWETIVQGVGVAMGGDKEEGRRALADCWGATTEVQHAQRCVIAHNLADLQESLDDEVRWDETALREHPHVADADLAPVGIASAAALAPSLHLNLGDGYLRQGRVAQAQEQLRLGLETEGILAEDGYGAMIRAGLGGLRSRLAEPRGESPTAATPFPAPDRAR